VNESKLNELRKKLDGAVASTDSHSVNSSQLFDLIVEIAHEVAKEEIEAFRLRMKDGLAKRREAAENMPDDN
jgi:hypothetical protein